MSTPLLTLPDEAHLPGRTPRPPEALFAPLIDAVSSEMTPQELADCDAFHAGRAAFDAGYYWEAHELWEAVWMCLPPAGAERLFMQGLIQLANVGLKRRMGRIQAAERVLMRADSALAEVRHRADGPVMGVNAKTVEAMRACVFDQEVQNNA